MSNFKWKCQISNVKSQIKSVKCKMSIRFCQNVLPEFLSSSFIIKAGTPPVCNIWLRRSVRSRSHTIPKKVRNSRPIKMGFKGWGWLLWWSWVTFKPFRYKKFNEWAQTANFSVLSRLRQELSAENPKKQENKRN